MASNIAGMFEQMNKAIQGNPLATRGAGMVDTMSQSAGGLMGSALGADPMSFMTQGGKDKEAKRELSQIDMSTPEGMMEAGDVFSRQGNAEKGALMNQQGTEAMEKQNKAMLEKKNIANLLEMVSKDPEVSQQDKNRYYTQIHSGRIKDEKDYIDLKDYGSSKAAEGGYTATVFLDGKEVPVRYNKNHEMVAVLGEGRIHAAVETAYNPETDRVERVILNKQTGEIKFTGLATEAAPKDTFDIKQQKDGRYAVYMYPKDGSAPEKVDMFEDMSDAEQSMAEGQAMIKFANLNASIGQAMAMIDDEATWTGPWKQAIGEFLPGNQARDLKAIILSINANVGFDSLARLKKMSGTSLGQVSNIENELLQSEITRLDTWTTGAQLKASLKRISNIYSRINKAVSTKNPDNLFTALPETGEKIYTVDDTTFVVFGPDGSTEVVIKGQ